MIAVYEIVVYIGIPEAVVLAVALTAGIYLALWLHDRD